LNPKRICAHKTNTVKKAAQRDYAGKHATYKRKKRKKKIYGKRLIAIRPFFLYDPHKSVFKPLYAVLLSLAHLTYPSTFKRF
jgi:hypothetical protein